MSLKCFLIAFVVSVFVSTASIYFYDTHYACKVVAVNLNSFLTKQYHDYLTGKIDKKDFKKNIKNLVSVIKSQPKNYTILEGSSILRGKILKIGGK